jgi:glycoside/pentoside/hexuronide:cation symporter, GPH family
MQTDNNNIAAKLPAEKLSLGTKIIYAIGGLGNAIGPGTIIPFWYTFFLTDIARLDLRLVSFFWVIVTIWDAIINPITGYLSDRTRSRWGRRRPYLLFGAIPFGLFFILLWFIPPFQNQIHLFLYFLITYILYGTASTVVTCPLAALAPELTQDHDERTSLIMYEMSVTMLASILVPVIFSIFILPMYPDRDPGAYQLLALICGIGFIFTSLIPFFTLREKPVLLQKKFLSSKETLQSMLKNKPYHYAPLIYVFGWMSVSVVTTLFAYYFIYWIGMGVDEVSMLQAGIIMAASLLLPAVFWLSRRFEKKTAYIIAAGSWAVLLLATLLIPQGAKSLAYIVCAFSGFGISAIHLLPSSMLQDAIEVDELATGFRQEGAYTGVSIFASKIGQMLILAIIPILLRWSGYNQTSGNVQPASTLLSIRLLIAILPAALLIISMIVAFRYPITREKHASIRQEIEKKKQNL